MTWFSRKRQPLPPPVDPDEAKRVLRVAREREQRTERVSRETRHAIAQNNFAISVKRAMES